MENLISLILLGLGACIVFVCFVFGAFQGFSKTDTETTTLLLVIGTGGVVLTGYALLRLFT